ncbi:MFS transporter [Pseudoclavibacter helvolus]|uniref:MFS transporter n=1 Tax=Pseudoclavibacter helvolus TaxID=255205 RepID=UPI003C725FDE
MTNRGPARPPLGRGFARLWGSAGLSNLADGVLKTAVPLIALQYTDAPLLLGLVAAAMSLPWLLFALLAGAIADRGDRRILMVAANIVRAAVLAAGALAVWVDAGSVWLLAAVAFCVGSMETVYDTSAQSIVPQLVGKGDLVRANARLTTVELTTNQFVGPPLGGVLVAAGAAVALVVPGAMWLAALLVLLAVPGSFRIARPARTTIAADVGEGLRFLWRSTQLRTLALMVGLVSLTISAAFTVLPLFATRSGEGADVGLGLSEVGYGVLLAVSAVGGVLGATLAAPIVRGIGRTASLTLTIASIVVLVGIGAVTEHPALVGAALAVGSAGISIWNVITVSFRQRVTPGALLGRVNSAYRLLAWGTMPIGAVLGGIVADAVGVQAMFAIAAGVVALAFLGLFVVNGRTMQSAEDAADGAD